MKKSSKILSITTLLLMVFCFTISAAMPSGVVVLGNKAYDLEYANDPDNYEEIYKQFTGINKQVFIKDANGVWHDNFGNEIDSSMIPALTYKDSEGNLVDYAAQDGEVVKLNVASKNFVSNNEIEITFNKNVDEESALNEENYKVDGQVIEGSLELKDSKTVVITLTNEVKDREVKTIEVSKAVKDMNKNEMEEDNKSQVLVLDKEGDTYSAKGMIGYDISILGDNQEVANAIIKGNVYIAGEKVSLKSSIVEGNVYVNPGLDGTTYINGVSAKEVVVLSGGQNSIYFENVNSQKLRITSDSYVRVVSKGKTKIKKTVVASYAVIDAEGGEFGEVTVSIDKSKANGENKTIELRGTFTQPIVLESSVKVVAAEGAEIAKLQINVKDEEAKIELEGDFKEVEVNEEAEVVLEEGTIEKVTTNAPTEITTGEDAEIEEIETNGQEVSQNGEEVVEEEKKPTPITPSPRPTPVDTKVDEILERVMDLEKYFDLVIYDENDKVIDSYSQYFTYSVVNNHKIDITIDKNATLEELLNKEWRLETINPSSDLIEDLKEDAKNVKVSVAGNAETNSKEYVKERLETAGYNDIAQILPTSESSKEDIISFVKDIYHRNDTTEILRALVLHGEDMTGSVYGEELKSVKVTLEGKETVEVYNINSDKNITEQEVKDLYNELFDESLKIESLKQLQLNDLKGKYELKIDKTTYTIVVK